MQKLRYIIELQFLGFRFHGWQKQKETKTVEDMVEKSLFFTLGTKDFKIMGCSRTDSKVSANRFLLELLTSKETDENFLKELNINLPPDIRAKSLKKAAENFSIINSPKSKEYIYLFSYGTKPHPFSAPLMHVCSKFLDIEEMKKGAKLFEGTHNFLKYCTKPGSNTKLTRDISLCEIVENNLYSANFFPEQSYMLRIKAKGFLRYQVRLIMGQLLSLGKGETDLDHITQTLNPSDNKPLKLIAPASGLILQNVEYEI